MSNELKSESGTDGFRVSRLARSILRSLVPLSVRRRLRRRWGWRWFRGDYPTWAEASAASGGYAADAILSRVLASTQEVRDGRAVFERDGVLFHTRESDEPLMRALNEVRGLVGGHLKVLDF